MSNKSQNKFCIVIILLFSTMTTSCAMFYGATVKQRSSWAPMSGSSKHFKQPCSTVIPVGKKALKASDLELESEDAIGVGKHVFYAEAGPFLLRQGEVARITFLNKPGGCKVFIKTEAKMAGNVLKKSTGEYSMEYFLALEGYLAETTMDDKYGSMIEEDTPAKADGDL